MDFPSAESLAQEMIRLAGNDTAYLEYFWWKVIGDDHVVGDDDGDDGDVIKMMMRRRRMMEMRMTIWLAGNIYADHMLLMIRKKARKLSN